MSDQEQSPIRSNSPREERERSRSRERSPSREDERSRSRSQSPRERSRSRSRSPVPAAADAADAPQGTWEEKLERLYARGQIQRGEIDDKVMDDLKALRDEEAMCVVDRLSETDFSRIKNINGFIGGIMRRVKTDGPDKGEASIDKLPRFVRDKLKDLIDDRKIDQKECDHRLVRALGDLSERNAEEALRRFDRSVDSNVRSRQGFMMGIIKRLQDEERGVSRGGSRGGGGGGGGYRDRDNRRGGGGSRDYYRDDYRDRDYGRGGSYRDDRGAGGGYGGRDSYYDDRDRRGGYEDRGYDRRDRGYDRDYDRRY